MKQRSIGATGLRGSQVGLGCNNFSWTIDEARSQQVVDKAIDLGVNFFDVAEVYGDPRGRAEEILGAALGQRRKDVIIVTKFGMSTDRSRGGRDSSRRSVISSCEGSLKRLGTDYIDIYMLHWADPATPIEETLRALDDLVHQGKVRYIACSNLKGWEVVDALAVSQAKNLHSFVAAQNEYSLLMRTPEAELIPALSAKGMSLLPYFPLASGMLTGKFKRGSTPADARLASKANLGDRFLTEANYAAVERLEAFARERGHTVLELAFSWLAAQPVVGPIIAGASRADQLEQNVKAVDWELSAEDLAAIDQACTG